MSSGFLLHAKMAHSVSSAEREGFEPPDPRRSTVFKTAAFDRSAIFPVETYVVVRVTLFALKVQR